jgi:hypothetical protein
MFDWLFGRQRIRALEDKLAQAKREVAHLESLCKSCYIENQQQRLLITALRDVNATLDTRCNEMEKRQ